MRHWQTTLVDSYFLLRCYDYFLKESKLPCWKIVVLSLRDTLLSGYNKRLVNQLTVSQLCFKLVNKLCDGQFFFKPRTVDKMSDRKIPNAKSLLAKSSVSQSSLGIKMLVGLRSFGQMSLAQMFVTQSSFLKRLTGIMSVGHMTWIMAVSSNQWVGQFSIS